MTVTRGAFIVFEGMDRTGKTTQCKRLVANLMNKQLKAEYTNFPDRTTEIGKVINNYLTMKSEMSDKGIHLLFSANRWEKISHIKKMLDAGITVIVDRYCYSGVAFSAAKGLDLEWCKMSDKGLLKPDRVFFLTMPLKSLESRSQFGNERYEVMDFQKKVYDVYKQLQDDTWEVIDANRSIEAVEEDIMKKTLSTVDNLGHKPIGQIWIP